MFKPEVLPPRIRRNVKVAIVALLVAASGPVSFAITVYTHRRDSIATPSIQFNADPHEVQPEWRYAAVTSAWDNSNSVLSLGHLYPDNLKTPEIYVDIEGKLKLNDHEIDEDRLIRDYGK